MKNIKIQRTEHHNIKSNSDFHKFIDQYCFKSKNLYNYANYIIRQEFINNGKWIQYNDLFNLVKESDPYKDLGSNTGQGTLRILDKNWKSFFKAIKDWKKNPSKYFARPKLPKYLNKDGRFILSLDSNKVKLKDGYIFFAWKPFKQFNNMFRTNAKERILQCRFVPKPNHYVMEIVYEIEVPDCVTESSSIVAIDLGVDNFITMVNNIGIQPIVIKGGIIKSINQFYNKKKAEIQSELKKVNKQDWSHRLQKLNDKRYEMIKYQMHCISKKVIDYCVLYNIDTLIVGRNKNWKQENQGMQNFTYIPYEMFIKMLAYKCQNEGIKFIYTEECYTSGTSFLDSELPIKDNYDKSRRIYRGLFVSNNGKSINADVNGAYQIMKKVIPNAFSNGIEGAGSHPIVIKVA
jgi:putative transposase